LVASRRKVGYIEENGLVKKWFTARTGWKENLPIEVKSVKEGVLPLVEGLLLESWLFLLKTACKNITPPRAGCQTRLNKSD
jgi:hypothetical protein